MIFVWDSYNKATGWQAYDAVTSYLAFHVGEGGAAPEPPAVVQQPGGSSKRRRRVIRYSDFETREALERELKIAAAPLIKPPIPFTEIFDEEDETDIIFQLLVLKHNEDL
jgi:hypothetical protein